MQLILCFIFLFLGCQFQNISAKTPLEQDLNVDILIRYHGERIHVKVAPHDSKLHPHVIAASLCSAVDLNMGEAGCKTSGFVTKTLVSMKSSSKGVEPNKFDARVQSSGAGLSFKPIQVIENWPLVYVEMEIKMKIPGKGWAANGKVIRKITRIDRANSNAGRAVGMLMVDATTSMWKWYVAMAIVGSFTIFVVVGMIQQKISRTRRKIRRGKFYSKNGIYQFSGGSKADNINFEALYKAETYQEQKQKEDRETQSNMEEIAKNNGMLVEEDDFSDWI